MKNVYYEKKLSTDEIGNIDKKLLYIIGVELKRKRLNKKKVLADYKCGCSLSYLSKIERGKIVPKMQVLNDYCQQNNISKKELQNMMDIDQRLDEFIYYLASGSLDLLFDCVSMYAKFDNYKTKILEMLYGVARDDLDFVKLRLFECVGVIDSLIGRDRNLIIFFSMWAKRKTGLYLDALLKMKNYDFDNNDNDALKALINREILICGLLSATVNPFEINCKSQYLFVKYPNLLDEKINKIYLDSIIRQGYSLSSIIYERLPLDLKIKYAAINNMEEELEKLSLVEMNDYDKLLYLAATASKEEFRSQFEKIRDSLSENEEIKYQIICDYYSLESSDFIKKVASEYISKISMIQDVVFINSFIRKMVEKCEASNGGKRFLIFYSTLESEVLSKYRGLKVNLL